MLSIERRIAADIAAQPAQVKAAVDLLDGGATVPFIARYRKEATGGLDDTQLRLLEERLSYLRELEDRRATILASIEEQGKLDETLKAQIIDADTKARLEDLYLPYKRSAAPRRRSRAKPDSNRSRSPCATTRQFRRKYVRLLLSTNRRRRRHQGCARWRTPDPDRVDRRERGPARRAARCDLEPRANSRQAHRRQGERRREVPRLLRPRRSDREDSLAPPARADARTQRRHTRARTCAGGRHRARPCRGRRPRRRARRHRRARTRRRCVAARNLPSRLARETASVADARLVRPPRAKAPRMRRSACSATTSRI